MPPQRPSRTSPEALEALRARLQATQAAAQKLAEEAASDGPPPMGWDVPRRAEQANDELDALISLLGTLRDVLPPELRAQLADLVRAVLDWWIGRLETGAAPAPEGSGDDGVQDIPIS